MLCDTLSHWKQYDFGPAWQGVMEWFDAHGADTAPGSYTVGECTISVSDTKTKRLDSCLFESHKRMVDVQFMYTGMEWLYTASTDGLKYLDDFDVTKDIGFHVVPPCETARVTLAPQTFTVLFPWDAHMPLVAVNNEPAPVRKAVAKIPVELFKLTK